MSLLAAVRWRWRTPPSATTAAGVLLPFGPHAQIATIRRIRNSSVGVAAQSLDAPASISDSVISVRDAGVVEIALGGTARISMTRRTITRIACGFSCSGGGGVTTNSASGDLLVQ